MKKNHSTVFPLPEETTQRRKWAYAVPVFYMVGTTSMMSVFINNFLSVFATELDAVSYIPLMSLVYTLGVAASAPIGGYFGDLYGRHHMALLSCIILFAGIMLAALAPSVVLFLLGLTLWGIGNGFDETFYNGMICDLFQFKDQTFFLSVSNSFNSGAVILSSVVSGYLMEIIRPRFVLSIAGAMLALGWVLLLCFGVNVCSINKPRRFDWGGAINFIIMIGSFCILFSVGGNQMSWKSVACFVIVALFFVATIGLYHVEGTSDNPLIDFHLFRIRYFLPVILVMAFNKLQGPITVYIMSYARLELHYSTSQMGNTQFLTLIPVFISPFIGKWLSRTRKFKQSFLISGILLVLQGFLMAILVTPETPYFLFLILRGIGSMASVFIMGPSIAFVSVLAPENKKGICLGLYTTLTYMFNSVFISLGGAVFNLCGGEVGVAFPRIALICGILSFGSIYITLMYIRNPAV